MSKICMNNQRGTSRFYSDNMTQPRFEKIIKSPDFRLKKKVKKLVLKEAQNPYGFQRKKIWQFLTITRC